MNERQLHAIEVSEILRQQGNRWLASLIESMFVECATSRHDITTHDPSIIARHLNDRWARVSNYVEDMMRSLRDLDQPGDIPF